MSDDAVIRFAEGLRARDERARATLRLVGDKNPEETGRANRLSRETGLPVDYVDRNLGLVQSQREALKASTILNKYPVIADWATDERHAAVGRDDFDNLGMVARTLSGYLNKTKTETSFLGHVGGALSSAPFRLSSGLYGALRGIAENVLDQQPLRRAAGGRLPLDVIPEWLKAQQEEGRAIADRIYGDTPSGFIARNLKQGLSSAPLSAAALATAAITRSPGAGAALIAGQVGGEAYGQARDEGLSPGWAAVFATSQGSVEYWTEKFPAIKYLNDITAGSGFAKTLVHNFSTEFVGEQAATALQDFNEWAALNPERPFMDYVAERPEAQLSTAIATFAATAVSVSSVEGARSLVKAITRQKSAEDGARALDELGGIESKTRARDTEAFRRFLEMQTEGTAAESIYVPAEAIAEYFQSSGMDWHDSDTFAWDASLPAQIDDALATGGDVIIKTADFATHVAGTPAWEALKEHVRIQPGGASIAEAREIAENQEEQFREFGARMSVEMETLRKDIEPLQKLYQSMRDKLTEAGFTQDAADKQAQLYTQRYATRTARLGQEVTGNETDRIEIRRILPERLAPIVAADNLDTLIATMRKDKAAKPTGYSLAEFVSRKGGVEDKGGELKTIGADTWHRGKPGRRKLIRSAQGAIEALPGLGGGIGRATGFGLDDIALRAWEAGYFPNLSERPSPQDLIDALEREMRGEPVYAETPSMTEEMRAAADDLRGILENEGIDPDAATKADIRKAVERYQAKRSEGRGFEQSPSDVARWRQDVLKIIRGDPITGATIRLGVTPAPLRLLGLPEGALVMSKAKIARVRREHPEVSLNTLTDLPNLISDPLAVFPSGKPDSSLIVAIDRVDADGNPIITPVLASPNDDTVVLSVYGKEKGGDWVARQIARAEKVGETVYLRKGLADASTLEAQSSDQGSSSHAPIASEGSTKPERNILSIKDAVKFDQSFADGPRGRVVFTDGKAVVELFQSANLSTFIHETGHIWLEELREDAESAAAPQQLKDDWGVVQDWFKANGLAVENGVIPVDAHELWARGFERYAMEGKSPSSGLRRAFDVFKSWLLSIYQVVDNLRSPITPEIREVMDRLIATDEEISQAREQQNIKALFTDAAQAGMTEAEFKVYQKSAQEARDEAFDALLFKTMAAIRRERTKAYREEEVGVRTEVADSVNRRPEWRALEIITSRTNSMRLNREWLVETYGEAALSLLPARVPPVYVGNGSNPDMIAELSGFTSGDEMVRALMGLAERSRELKDAGEKHSLKQVLIEQETTAIMRERHGDPLSDGSIEEEALALIHNDKQGGLIASELRQLGKRSNRLPTPYRLAREWAVQKIAASRVTDALSGAALQSYARAAAKAGKAAEKAMLDQDVDETFRQKQAQMLNNALIVEAKKAKDEIDVAVARLGKLAKRATSKTIDQDYLDQAHQLLEQVEFRTVSQTALDERESYEAWATTQQAAGFDIVNPPSFAAQLGKRNWSRLSVEELLGLDETVKQIVHLGRLKQKLLDGKEEREFNAIVTEAEDMAGHLPPKPPSDLMEPSRWDAIKSRVASIDASLLKMETVFDWLDGGNPNGVFNRVVFRRIADAQDAEKAMITDYVGRLTDILKVIPKEQLARWSERVTAPELLNRETGNPWIFRRDELVSMALNMGNEGNAAKLAGGYGWSEEAIMRVLNRELSAADWTYVQSVWDTIDTLWPAITAMEKRLNGIEPEKVEARPLATSAGDLRGGYFPVVYDPRKSLDADAQAARSSDSLFENIYTRAATPKGFTKTRTKVQRPIHLSLGIINRHVAEVIHDVTHREAIIDADRFLGDKRVMKAVDDSLGPEVRRQFRPWLQHIANEWAIDRRGLAGWDAFAKKLRTNSTMVGMGFRISTIIMQIAGYSNTAERIGARWVGQGIAATLRDPVGAWRFVSARSPEVRNRMDTLERDIRENVKATLGKTDLLSEAKRFAFYGIGMMDRVVVVPTWIGTYNRAISEGMSEADAGYAADKAVRQSQGAGAAKDLAAVQRSNEFMRLVTMFYSYQSAVYQRLRTLGRDASLARTQDLPHLIARSFFLVMVPPILSELLAGRGPDDDEDEGMWAIQRMLLGLLGPIPFARDVANAVESGFGYSFTPAARAFETGINVVKDTRKIVEGEETTRATRNALEVVGYAFGLPTGQLATATQFIVDVSKGEQDPQSVSDWWEGLTKGKLVED